MGNGIWEHNNLFLAVVVMVLVVVGCNSLQFVVCGDNRCDVGEGETCAVDCEGKVKNSKIVRETLKEGQSGLYWFNGKRFELNVLMINEVVDPVGVKLNINQEITPLLNVGDKFEKEGADFFIKDLIVNRKGKANDKLVYEIDNRTKVLGEGELHNLVVDGDDYYVKNLIIADKHNPEAVVKFEINDDFIRSLRAGEKFTKKGLELGIDSIVLNKGRDNVPDMVEFTINGKKETLEEGGERLYDISGGVFEVKVLIIGDNGNDAQVRLNVNNKDEWTFARGEKFTLSDDTVLKVEDIVINEIGERGGNLIEVSLDYKVNKILNDKYNDNKVSLIGKDYNVDIDVVDEFFEDDLVGENSARFVLDGDVMDRVFEGDTFLVDESCKIKVNEISSFIDDEELVDVTFSCSH